MPTKQGSYNSQDKQKILECMDSGSEIYKLFEQTPVEKMRKIINIDASTITDSNDDSATINSKMTFEPQLVRPVSIKLKKTSSVWKIVGIHNFESFGRNTNIINDFIKP